jgi:hypothetical protein
MPWGSVPTKLMKSEESHISWKSVRWLLSNLWTDTAGQKVAFLWPFVATCQKGEGPVMPGLTHCDSITNTGTVLQVYEGLIPVYTSGVYSVCGGTRQFTVNVAGERQRRGLQLRGDILLKCYHRHYHPVPTGSPSSPVASAAEHPQRELIFACQFHTCAVTDYTLSFTRQELDFACSGQYASHEKSPFCILAGISCTTGA